MITLTINNEKIQVQPGITGNDLKDKFPGDNSNLIGVRISNLVASLRSSIFIDSKVEPVYANSVEGSQIYRRTLSFILAAASHKLFPKEMLVIGHSLGNGYYYSFPNKKITSKEIDALQKEMTEIIKKDLPIDITLRSYEDACKFFEEENLLMARKQLDYQCNPVVRLTKMESFQDIYSGPCAASTGVTKIFELMPYDEGFLLRFPAVKETGSIPEFVDNPKIFEIFKQYKAWGKQVGVTSAADLNEKIIKGKINDFIDIAETFQSQNYAKVAQMIKDRGNVKVVLIAGPSSSGKTTSAKKIALHLQALGYNPKVISLDNYYVGREQNPKDENGNYDYECLEALDVELLNQNLNDLFAGKEVEIPSYNFDLGERYYNGNKMHLDEKDILIMEGIHGLNDRLTPKVKSEFKFKIYLSALTPLNLNFHERVSTSDNRLIRRIVRDSKFRGKSAGATISMWESVQKGERLHIFPFQNNADAVLNTALDFEIPVLKVYATPLLRAVKPTEPEYSEACRLLDFLGNFDQIPADHIPKQSIVREFIGGSGFHY